MLSLSDAISVVLSGEGRNATPASVYDCDEAVVFVYVNDTGHGVAHIIKKDSGETIYEDPFWAVDCRGYGEPRLVDREVLEHLGLHMKRLEE